MTLTKNLLLSSCLVMPLTCTNEAHAHGGGDGEAAAITAAITPSAPASITGLGGDAKGDADEDNEDNIETGTEINDPLEPLNRLVFIVNKGVDGLIMKPLAIAYRLVLPEPVRNSVGNFYTNINSPVSFANHLLQGTPKEAGNSLARFVINSTVGILGLFDAAETFGFKSNETGLSDTLGVWGVNTGPYLILPALGPSSFRGVVGIGGDYFTQPYNYLLNDADSSVSWIVTGIDLTHQRNLVLEKVDELSDSALDLYAAVRSIYFQSQKHRLEKLKKA